MILRNSKQGLGAKNMFYSEKKIHITPIPPHNGHLSTTAIFFSVSKVAVVERFDGTIIPAGRTRNMNSTVHMISKL